MNVRFGRKTIIALSAIPCLIALAVVFGPSRILVDIGVVERGPMTVTVDSEGRTRIRNIYVVPATASGYMPRIPFKPGDPIKKDEVIAKLYPPEPEFLHSRERAVQEARIASAEAQLGQARADVVRARAQLALANADLARQKSLQATGTASQRAAQVAEVDVSVKAAEVDVAEKTVTAREAQLRMEQAALTPPTSDIRDSGRSSTPVLVTSPVDGAILKATQESETIVNKGAPLVEVGDPRDLEIMLEMLTVDAVKLKVGAPAVIYGWGLDGKTLSAKVRKIEPEGFTKVSALGVEEQRTVVVLDFTEPPERLSPFSHGYRIYAKIPVWEAADVVKAPIGALFRLRNQWNMFVVENGVAHLRKVTIGHTNDDFAEILDGAAAGDMVIVHPSDQIEDGAGVTARTSR